MVHAKKMVGFGSIVLHVTVLDIHNAIQMVLVSNAKISLPEKIVKDVR